MQRVVMSGSDTAKASFKAPIVPVNNSALTFKLTVKDNSGLNSSDLVRVSILKAIKPDNPPRANAGVDQAAAANTVVTLIGNKSFDLDAKDNLTYHWKQIGGIPLVTLRGSNSASPQFTAPDVSTNSTLFFSLTASDGRMNNTDYVNVTVYKPQGFPLWLPVIPAAAGGGAAVWYFFFRKPPKPKTKLYLKYHFTFSLLYTLTLNFSGIHHIKDYDPSK